MINKIVFSNYKAFQQEQELELKPITILIGKNSSGKSSISKLIPLFSSAFSQEISLPILLEDKGIEFGNAYRDLVYRRQAGTPIIFQLEFTNQTFNIEITPILERNFDKPVITKWSYSDSQNSISFYSTGTPSEYKNDNGEFFTCEFSGLIPISIVNKDEVNILEDLGITFPKIKENYIGPFRELPPRVFKLSGKMNFSQLGMKGENAYQILGNSKVTGNPLLKNVSDLFEKYFDGWAFDIDDETYKPFMAPIIKKKLKDSTFDINIADVGEGISQVLPIIVRASMDLKNTITVLEQPELHLHPAAHGDIAELIANTVTKKENLNAKFLIETHSENFILRLRKLIVDEKHLLNEKDVIIYWIDTDDDDYCLEPITINKEGKLSDWPEGIFKEGLKDLLKINELLQN